MPVSSEISLINPYMGILSEADCITAQKVSLFYLFYVKRSVETNYLAHSLYIVLDVRNGDSEFETKNIFYYLFMQALTVYTFKVQIKPIYAGTF